MTAITNVRNVQGTDITSEKNVQNQFTVQMFTKPVYSICIHTTGYVHCTLYRAVIKSTIKKWKS